VRPRNASEWRHFWRHGGEEALEALLREVWLPLGSVDDERLAPQAERIALLLGSAAPTRAIASELGRIRHDLGADPDADADRVAADRVHGWFQAQTRV
jgi:hypothetical protein